MKTFILLILLSSTGCFSQEIVAPNPPIDSINNIVIDDMIIDCSCDYPAEFPGGNTKLQEYIKANLDCRSINLEKGLYKAYVEFIVVEDGSLSEIEVVRGINEVVDSTLINLFSNMPNWLPYRIDSSTRKTRVRVPVSFEIK